VELRRDFRAIGIFGQREAASEVTKGARNLIRKSNGNVSFVGGVRELLLSLSLAPADHPRV
jgi:hypothetical protein